MNTSKIEKILCDFVVLIFYYFLKHCKLNKPKIMKQSLCNFTQLKKKKVAGETVQVEQIKSTITSRHSHFLYIDNII